MPTGAHTATGIGSPRAACPRMKHGVPPRRYRPGSFAGDATTDPQTGIRVTPDESRQGPRTGHGCVALHRSSARPPSGGCSTCPATHGFGHALVSNPANVCVAAGGDRRSDPRHLDGGVERPGASHTRRSPARRDPRIGSQSCAAVPIEGHATVEAATQGRSGLSTNADAPACTG